MLLDKLTPMQRKVALVVLEGYTLKEAAIRLHINAGCVSSHITSIYNTLRLRSSTHRSYALLFKTFWAEAGQPGLCKNCQAELFNEVITNGNNR